MEGNVGERDLLGDLEDFAVFLAALDSDDDDDEPAPKVFVDVEQIRRLDGETFRKHFRMEKHVFQRLVVLIGNHLRETNRLRRLRTPLDLAVLSTLWLFGTQDTFRSCALQFNTSPSVVYYHYAYLIRALRELAPRFVKWPSERERDAIKVRFENRYGFPGVIGCIDGTHIKITAPVLQCQRYINRHHDYSILVQAVCDDRLAIRDVYVGQPGSVGDNRMYNRSLLSDNLLFRQDLISPEEHILGDGAYTLTTHIQVPYTDDGHLTNKQRRYNLCLSRARSSVERTFALFKNKFRRLKFFHNYNFQVAIDHIMASAMLHNFVIFEGEEPDALLDGGEHVGVHGGMPREALMATARIDGVRVNILPNF